MWNDPEVCGGFLLVRQIAESAMASVHLAVRLGDASGKTLVLKRPPFGERPSGRAAQAILREAEVLGEVRGAGLPALEAAGDIAGLPYVAIERLRGASLAKVLGTGAALPIGAVRAVGKDIARALGKLHEAGWVHRDVTPSNLFVDDAGEAYLLDFGLCARPGDDHEAAVAGTRGYAAPEAATPSGARPAQDVYGLAVCLAEAALGRRIFDEASLVEAAARGDAPPQVAALEGQLPGITAALRRDPAARPSAADFAAGLGQEGERALLAERAQAPDTASAGALPRPEAPLQTGAMQQGAMQQGAVAAQSAVETPHTDMFRAAPSAVTPTLAMPLASRAFAAAPAPPEGDAGGVLPTLRDAPEPLTVRSRGRAATLAIGALLLLAGLTFGFFSGRFTTRIRGGTFAISGTLPKRSECTLDNKKLTFAEGVPMTVAVGPHVLVITSPKTGKREIPFTVRPGEHIVILSPVRAAGADSAALVDEAAP